MSLQALYDTAEIARKHSAGELPPEQSRAIELRLQAVRESHRLIDAALEEQVIRKTPSMELLNRSCSI